MKFNQYIYRKSNEVVLDQGVRRKGKKSKVASIQTSSQQPTISSNTSTEQPSSALAALEAILTAVGPWLDAETHQMVSSTLLSLSLSPSNSSLNLSPKLLASLCSSPHQCAVPLVLPALHQRSLVLGKRKVESIAGVKSLLANLHPQCASLDLKATPMVSTNQLANAVENLEDEEEEEETESELSTQLREAKEKISALEDKLKAQERLLKEAEENRSFGSESVGAKHSRSSGQVNNELESQNIAVKRPAAAEEEAIVKKIRGSYEKFGQEKGINSDQTKHPEATSTSAQPSGSRSSTIESVSSSSATPVPLNITKPSKDLLENTAPLKSTATALPPVSAGGEGAAAAGQQLTVAEMLADFKDKLSDNLLRMGNPSYVNATLQDSDSD